MHRLSKTVVLHTARCSHQPEPGADRGKGPYRGGLHLHWRAARITGCRGSGDEASPPILAGTGDASSDWTTSRRDLLLGGRRRPAASALSRAAGSSRLRLPLPTGSGFDMVVGLRSAA